MSRKSQARSASEPARFHIFVGGFARASYDLRLVNGRLEYRANDSERPEILLPTSQAWERFWRAADGCDLWNWTKSYDNRDMLDGTQWKVEITLGSRRIKSGGSNAYPGEERDGGSYPEPFMRLLQAVQELVGGRAFG
jgi:hypothetical protein